jgi:hypothetical protein
MTARINEIAVLIRPYVEQDDHKLTTTEAFEQGLSDGPLSGGGPFFGGIFIGLGRFVSERNASIAAQLAGTSPASNGDGSGNGGVRGLAGAGPRVPAGGGAVGIPGPGGQQPPPGMGRDGAMPGGSAGGAPPGGALPGGP